MENRDSRDCGPLSVLPIPAGAADGEHLTEFGIQGVETVFIFPGGYFHLYFTQERLHVLFLSVSSPGQNRNYHGRGVGGAVVRAASGWIADRQAQKLASRIENFESGTSDEGLFTSKYSYSIPTSAISRLCLDIFGSPARAELTVELSDRSGPCLRRNKRVFRLEPLFPTDLGQLASKIRAVMKVPVEVNET